jgi:hypothetical protein
LALIFFFYNNPEKFAKPKKLKARDSLGGNRRAEMPGEWSSVMQKDLRQSPFGKN